MIFTQFLANFTVKKIHRLLQIVNIRDTSSGALFAVGNLSSSARFIRRSSRNRLRSDSAAIWTRFCTWHLLDNCTFKQQHTQQTYINTS